MVAAIMDVRIMFNVVLIGNLGDWIRGLEAVILQEPQSMMGWELYLRSKSVLFSPEVLPWLPMDRRLLTSVLFLVALYVSTYASKRFNKMAWLAASMCLLVMALPGFYEGHGWLHVIIAGIGISLLSLRDWSSKSAISAEAFP